MIYNTYQCYLRSVPATVAEHLDIARKEGFTLGAKLVRGTYQSSEDPQLIQTSIEATHAAFDGVITSLIERQHNSTLQFTKSACVDVPWPLVNMVVATHNADSVHLAQRLQKDKALSGTASTPLTFAQLQGMADEVSCSLLAANSQSVGHGEPTERVFKFVPWGTMRECLNYLLRRAAENGDAASRTTDTRKTVGNKSGEGLGKL